ncbi:MAG: DUF4011 domain-containing protein [Bacteroidetes bacterium]|nr:DUF4011 domain-containing protein [Bacteroidota bacterium]
MNSIDEKGSAFLALKNLRNRLLDLTARNRLINFRYTKRGSLRIIDELPDMLVEMLLSEKEMRFLPVPEPSREELVREGFIRIEIEDGEEIQIIEDPQAEEWAKHIGLSTGYEVPMPSMEEFEGKHTDKAIQTLFYPYELETRLKNLRQTAESAIQEMGSNILFLSVGFLEWYDNLGGKPRIAPLFLVPIRIHRGRLNKKTKIYEYTVTYSGEDIIPNLSLREKLKADFAMALPDLDENSTPEEYFLEIQELIEVNQPSWKIRRNITIALLNFSKLLIYLDLDPKRWSEDSNIINHPIVTKFVGSQDLEEDEGGRGIEGFSEEHLIDEMEDVHTKYPLINDADSSQHSALIDAIEGHNLVIEGPPGTGKSQTITNLIAAALSQGKKVLFVAEKLAALEVVHRKLEKAGLSEFCLELHSYKSQKKKILDDVKFRLKKHGTYRQSPDIDADIDRYEELKELLNRHVKRINKHWKNTKISIHEIFMAATRYRIATGINPSSVHPIDYDGVNYTPTAQRKIDEQVEAYKKLYITVASQIDGDENLNEHPWHGVNNTNLQIFDLDTVLSSLVDWQASISDLKTEIISFCKLLNINYEEINFSFASLSTMTESLDYLPALQGNEHLQYLEILKEDLLKKTEHYLAQYHEIQQQYSDLANDISPDILNDLTMISHYHSGSINLSQLVEPHVRISEINHATNRLKAINDYFIDLAEPMQAIENAVDENTKKYFGFTTIGLNEFKTFLDMVSNLKSSYWKLRDDLYDDDQLDDIIPKIRQELMNLQTLHDELEVSINLNALPNSDELILIINTLNSGGILRWLKGNWRKSRKQALSYAKNIQTKYSEIEPLLQKAAEFIKLHSSFDNNIEYNDVLGSQMRSLKTDVNSIEALRNWYKTIRESYGVGFGPKVGIGNAIINLPGDVAKGIRSLTNQGIDSQIAKLLDEFENLKKIFSSKILIHNENAILSGNDGAITEIINSVNNALISCGQLVEDKELSIAEIVKRAKSLKALEYAVNEYDFDKFEQNNFQGDFSLEIGLNTDNEDSLSTITNTLLIANRLEQDVSIKEVNDYIYKDSSIRSYNTLISQVNKMKECNDLQEEKLITFSDFVNLKFEEWGYPEESIDEVIKKNTSANENSNSLQNWLDYIRVREQAIDIGLEKLISEVENDNLEIHIVDEAYKAGIFDLLSREILREQPALGRFSGISQKAIQEKFIEYDNNLKSLQSEQIAWQIDQREIPNGNFSHKVSELSENYLLRHECEKKKRHIPIRRLVNRAGKALVALKPCFMMGPMSVAQYLEPNQIEFDLVIMDEASQIKPQDAIGAIARGTQLIVVGDPKQLPPTSFFDRVVDYEDIDATGIEESESILDATTSMFRSRRLRWHYRSQHESLISFSNYSFYDGDLVLFPSPYKSQNGFGIKYSRLPRGCFVNRRNTEEARAISEAVREHFKNNPGETLGIVTMSSEQRLIVEKTIETLAKKDVLFHEMLEDDARKQDPLFIKNLENVQGDERDVILISMTYGPPEPRGKVYQRFGPINYDVGWRRLNVLFTRSKKRMHIFSSMGSQDIIAGSNAKRGVRALRDFLSYCETGQLHKTIVDSDRPPDSDFEIAVMDALEKEGFECVPQVGVAGFFIDVAVLDPGNSGRYLMGIECDGATYHSAKSARDRDRLRQTILERLGWNIKRIWSTDWFKNPDAELKPIIRELNNLKSEKIKTDLKLHVEDVKPIYERDDLQVELPIIPKLQKSNGISLFEKLTKFDSEIIRREFPNTDENQRLLRPAMIEAFQKYLPTDINDFLEFIPLHLREEIDAKEGKYLKNTLDIVNSSFEVESQRSK